MSKPVAKGGKMPLSQKKSEASDLYFDEDPSILTVDPALKRELEAKGYAVRWINAGQYRNGGNFHKNGWQAYRPDQSATQGALSFQYGISADGFIIRNDLLLAIKPIEHAERQRARIKQKADMMAGVEKRRAAELRETMRAAGLGTKVFEGYEGNGDGDGGDLE